MAAYVIVVVLLNGFLRHCVLLYLLFYVCIYYIGTYVTLHIIRFYEFRSLE